MEKTREPPTGPPGLSLASEYPGTDRGAGLQGAVGGLLLRPDLETLHDVVGGVFGHEPSFSGVRGAEGLTRK